MAESIDSGGFLAHVGYGLQLTAKYSVSPSILSHPLNIMTLGVQ